MWKAPHALTQKTQRGGHALLTQPLHSDSALKSPSLRISFPLAQILKGLTQVFPPLFFLFALRSVLSLFCISCIGRWILTTALPGKPLSQRLLVCSSAHPHRELLNCREQVRSWGPSHQHRELFSKCWMNEWTHAGECTHAWLPSNTTEGLPWRSSGQDSALPIQGAWVQFLLRELDLTCCSYW